MKHLQAIIMLCITLVIASCASTQQKFVEVKIPPERIYQNGYSFVPLNEKGWKIVGRNQYQLALAKGGDNPDETFAIQAIAFRLSEFKSNEEFVRIIKEGQSKDTDPKRFKIVKHEVTSYPMNGTDCAKSHLITEDHAAVKRSEKSGDMILEVLTLTCALPSDKRIGISIVYSQRHYPEQGDAAFADKATSILNSVEFSEPEHPYIASPQQSHSEWAAKFVSLCSEILSPSSEKLPSQPQLPQSDAKQETDPDPIHKLASIGISIGRIGYTKESGSYALFEKGPTGDYSLIAVKPDFIEPNIKNQEELFVSLRLDNIAPAFASFDFREPRQAFLCGTGAQGLTGISSSGRAVYNPCDSELTSANLGSSVLMNILLTGATLGANVVTGSTATFVDTDKEKVAKLIVNSKLFQCLTEANQNGLKAEVKAMLAKEFSDANRPDSREQVDGDCSDGEQNVSPEAYFHRGNELMGQNKYKAAMVCFMRAQEVEKDTQIYRDSCSHIATMYELGWGVDKNMEKSKEWLNKAGL